MRKALRAMRVLLAVMTVCVCLILCWQAIDICRIGNLPENFSSPGVRIHPVYSLPIVRERLTAVAPVLAIYLAAVAVGLMLQALDREKPRPSVCRGPEETLRRRMAAGDAPRPVSPYLRAALYAVAVVLIVLGVMNGGLRDVLVKAINICTECIGLG